jgi:hypothetical protein
VRGVTPGHHAPVAHLGIKSAMTAHARLQARSGLALGPLAVGDAFWRLDAEAGAKLYVVLRGDVDDNRASLDLVEMLLTA